MDFSYTDDQRLLDETLRRYLSDRSSPEDRNRDAYGPNGYSAERWRELAELGIIGALLPAAAGGFGGGATDVALIFEALGQHLATEPFLPALMAGRALHRAGGRQPLLEAVLAGNAVVPLVGADRPGTIPVRATAAENGWRLQGDIALAAYAESAIAFLVPVRTEKKPLLLLVLAAALRTAITGQSMIDGGRGSRLLLDDVEVRPDACLGGIEVAEESIAWGLLALCAEALGAMESIKQATLEYMRTRVQFGTAIGSFQALQHRMVDLAILIEQARSSVINAIATMEAGPQERDRTLSAAKVTIGQAGTRIAEEAIQLHGAIGMTWELPLSHYAKRLVMIDHQLGDSDCHLKRFIQADAPAEYIIAA